MQSTHFERAIFISWYCSKRDCAFCYLSSKKCIAPDPAKDRRTKESILAEAIICKACGWEIEFISGGCDSYNNDELLSLLKCIKRIYGKKLWLNVGILNEKQLKLFRPYIEGVCGTVECITPKLRDRLCPSKPLNEIEDMFKLCDKLKLKKAITIILGLGETLNDFKLLKKFIKKNHISQITFYRLKPQKGTIFENKKPMETDYYVKWVEKTRNAFPKLKIVVGSWLTHLSEIHLLLNAGADAITKFPSIKLFNTKYAKKIEEEAKKANRKFIGTLTKLPKIKTNKLNKKTKLILTNYLKRMSSKLQ
ncbi:radical SAM protein [Candidatus Woesearchaeota archaeon]|nr:radical SAM protein [Candidatus Woesearchaeota archaeon]